MHASGGAQTGGRAGASDKGERSKILGAGASGSGGRPWGERGGVGTQQSSPNALICGEEWWKGSNIEKWGGARRARWCARGGASERGRLGRKKNREPQSGEVVEVGG